MPVQIINDSQGKPAYAVVPYDEYLQSDLNDDSVAIPHDVVGISVNRDVSIIAAWRMHRGLSQDDVCAKLGITQPSLSKVERVGSKARLETREKLAKIYNCDPEQLLDC